MQSDIVLDRHATTIIGPLLVQGAHDTDPVCGRFKHTGAWMIYFHLTFLGVPSPLGSAVPWHAITICIRAGYSFSCTHGLDTCSWVSPVSLLPRHNQAHPSFRILNHVDSNILL